MDWEAVARAHTHPLRLEILARLDAADEPLSPVMLAGDLGRSLGSVAHHVRGLHALGLIEATGTRPRRGAVEHFYRLR